MSDPFKSVSSGEALSIPAAAWNTLLRVARAEDTGAATGPPSGRQSTIIRVKNESLLDLPRNSVLGLEDPVFIPYSNAYDNDDVFLREVTFRGIEPAGSRHRRRFVITIDPVPQGGVARCYIAGVCQVKVNVLNAWHEYATIAEGETTHLVSSRFGHAQILWTETEPYGYAYDVGIMWAIVRIGAHCPSVAIGRANGDITPRVGTTYGTGRVDIYRLEAGNQADGPVETIDVWNASADISSGVNGIDDTTWVSIGWDMEGIAWVAPLECTPGAYA